MELLLVSVLVLWLAVAVLVVGLCTAAARGDRDTLRLRARELAPFAPEDRTRLVAGRTPTAGPGQTSVG